MNTDKIVEVPSCPELRIDPLYLLRVLADYDSDYAVIVSIGQHHVFQRDLDYDVNYEEDHIRFIAFVIEHGNAAVQSMIRQAYQDHMILKIGNSQLPFGKWSLMLKDMVFYRPSTIARVVEVKPPSD